eukprot:2761215-Rhodomonas_salina.1
MEEADGTLRHGTPLRPRFLTPVEFRRIMGFPDSFDVSPLYEGGGVGHIYQVLGNAVVPPVIEAIGREMLRLMQHVEAREKSAANNRMRSNQSKERAGSSVRGIKRRKAGLRIEREGRGEVEG